MKFSTLVSDLLLVLTLVSTCAGAEVWKCREGDRVVFSDQPCPKTGAQIDERKLQGNTLQAESVYRSPDGRPEYETDSAGRVIRRSDREAAQSVGSSRGSVCPTDLDIRNMQVRANSMTLGPQQKQFMYDEIRRARQCAAGQGAYSAKDWEASRDAQGAQSSIAGGRRERVNAEGVHSAADPIEGDRIAARRAQVEAARAYAEAERRRIESNRSRDQITTCDPRGCYTEGGQFYYDKRNGTFAGNGAFCRREGNMIRCP